MSTKLTAAEKNDRTALQAVRDTSVCVRSDIVKAAGKATLDRLLRRGWAVRDANSEYADALQLTWDGLDYLGELEQPWITD